MILCRLPLGAIVVVCAALSSCAKEEISSQPVQYSGMCDASAGVALGDTTFIVADDERNILQVYRSDRAGPPIRSIPWDVPLGIRPQDEHPEVDMEGATVLGDHIYWISSHGRNRNGKWRPNRHRFFAMTVSISVKGIVARPFGKPCGTLIWDLVRDERMRDLGVAKAFGAGVKESKKLAPKREGLNVEGLCAAADGKSLLIAFRNPRPDGQALLVPLHNPAQVLGDQAAPKFGQPIQLKLEAGPNEKPTNFGIRSIEYSRRHAAYLVVAGPHDERKAFALYRWSGKENHRPKLLRKSTAVVNRIERFNPEALIVYPEKDKIQVLSDDGTLKVKVRSPAECLEGTFEDGACEAKYLLDDTRRTFRSIWVDVE